MNLYDELKKYSENDIYPMHMPGHKRNEAIMHMKNPYSIDITEIEGFDNLHDAQGILKDGMERAARLYHSEDTFYLVNGSTVGLLAAIACCTKKGDKILVGRNCHKAVYNAIYLNELTPIYLYPLQIDNYDINGGISVEKVKEMLIKHPEIKMVVITSPTYEGILSDIDAIADIVHERNIPLLVDEAHGAHFGFHESFPQSAIQKRADIVIHSIHKTLPSFTQTSLLHRNGELVKKEEIKRYLSIYQSSSPSYLLMSSIDQCICMLAREGNQLFDEYDRRLESFYDKADKLKHIRIYKCQNNSMFDRGKLIISVKGCNMNGTQLYQMLLEKYHIQMELVSKSYVLGMTSICDTDEGFDRLIKALLELDEGMPSNMIPMLNESEEDEVQFDPLVIALSSYETYQKEGKAILMEQSEGYISKEYVFLYPPGIPLIVPGEVISSDFIKKFKSYQKEGLTVSGLYDKNNCYIEVVSDSQRILLL